jgi:uncharacterized protein YjiS (DUF1127 family)
MPFLSLALQSHAPRQRRFFLTAIETLELWGERRRQRRELRHLAEDTLRDIGLSQADIDAEACKPFWRA